MHILMHFPSQALLGQISSEGMKVGNEERECVC